MAMHDYTPSDVKRFWAKVDTSAGMFGCWLWTASKDKDGYGWFVWCGKNARAHKVSWELAHGDIPNDLLVLHNCPDGDNPSCVNPAHLWVGTTQANLKDRDAKGRTAAKERHGNAKLTEVKVREIRRRYALGNVTQKELADEFGVDFSLISQVVRGKAWRGVTP